MQDDDYHRNVVSASSTFCSLINRFVTSADATSARILPLLPSGAPTVTSASALLLAAALTKCEQQFQDLLLSQSGSTGTSNLAASTGELLTVQMRQAFSAQPATTAAARSLLTLEDATPTTGQARALDTDVGVHAAAAWQARSQSTQRRSLASADAASSASDESSRASRTRFLVQGNQVRSGKDRAVLTVRAA